MPAPAGPGTGWVNGRDQALQIDRAFALPAFPHRLCHPDRTIRTRLNTMAGRSRRPKPVSSAFPLNNGCVALVEFQLGDHAVSGGFTAEQPRQVESGQVRPLERVVLCRQINPARGSVLLDLPRAMSIRSGPSPSA